MEPTGFANDLVMGCKRGGFKDEVKVYGWKDWKRSYLLNRGGLGKKQVGVWVRESRPVLDMLA